MVSVNTKKVNYSSDKEGGKFLVLTRHNKNIRRKRGEKRWTIVILRLCITAHIKDFVIQVNREASQCSASRDNSRQALHYTYTAIKLRKYKRNATSYFAIPLQNML